MQEKEVKFFEENVNTFGLLSGELAWEVERLAQ